MLILYLFFSTGKQDTSSPEVARPEAAPTELVLWTHTTMTVTATIHRLTQKIHHYSLEFIFTRHVDTLFSCF
jgi:hypothetical protein